MENPATTLDTVAQDKLTSAFKLLHQLFGESGFIYKAMKIENNTITLDCDSFFDPGICLNALLNRGVISGRSYEVRSETDRFEITGADLTVLASLLEWQTSQNQKVSRTNITTVLDQLSVPQPKIDPTKVVVIEREEHRDIIDGALWNNYWASKGKPNGPGGWGIPVDIATRVEEFSNSRPIPSKH